jgi:hypothetical protein
VDGDRSTPHALRRTFASLLIEAGEPLIDIQEQFDHYAPAFTLAAYGHLLPPGDHRAVDRLDEATVCNPRAPGAQLLYPIRGIDASRREGIACTHVTSGRDARNQPARSPRKENAMHTMLGALAGVLLLTGLALAADETKARSPQAERMTRCNAEARNKKLAGDERRHFMSECLKGQASREGAASTAGKPAPGKSSGSEAHSTQTEKMKACSQEAATRKLQGDDRRQFMSECLKAEKKS